MELFREMLDRPNSDNPLGMRLSEELGTQCDHSTCCKATGFHSYCGCQAAGFQGYYKVGKRRTGAGYDARELVILIKLSQCFLSKHTSDSCKPLVGFQISEKVALGNFCHPFHCFYVGAYLQRSSAHYFGSSTTVNICLILSLNIQIFIFLQFFSVH